MRVLHDPRVHSLEFVYESAEEKEDMGAALAVLSAKGILDASRITKDDEGSCYRIQLVNMEVLGVAAD